MRILCLNGNTTESITTRVADEMRRTLDPSVEVIDGTPELGPPVIYTRVDLVAATHAIVDKAMNVTDVDGIMLAVSFDSGRDALREALDLPVIGMTEASVAMARMNGSRIGYVSLGKSIEPLYWENLHHCHLKEDLAAWETIEAPSAYSSDSYTEADNTVIEACQAVMARGADVVVLLGAVMAGVAHRIQPMCEVPVIDGGAAGAVLTQAAIRMRPTKN